MTEKKRAGRPPIDPGNRSCPLTLNKRHLILLDRLIHNLSGPTKTAAELTKRRRDYLGSLIEEASPQILLDMRRSLESQVDRLTKRIEAVESPYLDFLGELLLMKDAIKNIEYQTNKRLDALEK